MEQTVDIDLVHAVEAACQVSRPRPHHPDLMARLTEAAPGRSFAHRASRGGWFRPGSVVTAQGELISPDLTGWAEAAWEAADEDGARLQAACLGRPEEADLRFDIGLPPEGGAPVATRLAGITHYFSAQYGKAPEAFIQLEVEETREVASHRPGEGSVPDSVEDLISPRQHEGDGRPLKPPAYRLRRVHDIARVLARLTLQQVGSTPAAVRFMADWSLAQNGGTPLAEHWLMQISNWNDRFGVARIGLKPLSLKEHLRPPVPEGADGVALSRALLEYDRRAGYGLAWYFDMVASRGVPVALAEQVSDHWEAGFRYLPERHAKVVLDYVRTPYRL
jgi:hypothetical protein